jgi:hypothetical protein
MTAADDWTVELAAKGLPELRQLYRLEGREELVEGYPLTQFPHNFNGVSRGRMYHWMNKFLGLAGDEPILEHDYAPLTVAEMSVWDAQHPEPPGGDEFERELLRAMSDASDEQMAALLPHDAGDMADFQRVVGGALRTILNCRWSELGGVEREMIEKQDRGDYWLFKDVLRNSARRSELPTVFLHPRDWNGEVVVWASGQGKASLMNENGEPRAEAQSLLADGFSIAAADLMLQGEFLASDTPLAETRKVENNRDFAGYTFGYNTTLLGQRVFDILTLVKFIQTDEHPTQRIHLLGIEGAAPWAVLARALAGQQIDKLAIDDGDFRFRYLKSWRAPDFLPGAIKYGDLPVMLGLGAPGRTWMATQTGEAPVRTVRIYQALGSFVESRQSTDAVGDAVRWLREN